jgi:hypothetical protein
MINRRDFTALYRRMQSIWKKQPLYLPVLVHARFYSDNSLIELAQQFTRTDVL